jgi:hypothetical protein
VHVCAAWRGAPLWGCALFSEQSRMMPGPLQPFVQTGKRGFAAFDSGDPFTAKRACGGFDGSVRPSAFDIENMAPGQLHAAAAGAGSCWQAQQQQQQQQQLAMQHGSEQAHTHMQHMHLQHLAQQRAAGGCASTMMECGDMPPGGGDGMDMDAAGAGMYSRYERFPSKSALDASPTHYHKSTAIGYVPPLYVQPNGSDESMVRSWECEYMGKNDYY